MKKLIVLSAVLLSACAGTGQEVNSTTEVNSDTVLDDSIFQEATSSNSIEKCDQILDSAKKDECKTVVGDFLTISEAIEKEDASMCDDIEDDRYRENCINSIDESLEEEQAQKKTEADAIKKDEERVTTETEAVEKGDISICEGIEDEKQAEACKYNVISELDDISLCDQLSDQELRTQCKQTSSEEDN